MHRDIVGLNFTEIAHAGASIVFRIGVDDFPPITGPRHTNPVIQAGDGSEIANDGDNLVVVLRFSNE